MTNKRLMKICKTCHKTDPEVKFTLIKGGRCYTKASGEDVHYQYIFTRNDCDSCHRAKVRKRKYRYPKNKLIAY